MSNYIDIVQGEDHYSTLNIEKDGSLRVLGIIPHGSRIRIRNEDSAKKLIDWVQAQFPDVVSAKHAEMLERIENMGYEIMAANER